ncbi:MAG: phage tail sheath family protein [Gemmatimonadetes bacterium]|nr:phage tail sheath family protein [Gemmatimonadota bacterium]
MPTASAAPGITFEFADPPRALPEVRTDIAGFVGFAERGPFHRPLRIESWQQYETAFGGFDVPGYLPLAVHAFFANGGATCYVVRALVPPGDGDREWHERARHAFAELAVRDAVDPSVRRSLRLIARSPGRWGNGVSVEVVPHVLEGGGGPTYRLTLVVRDRSGAIWRLADCSVDPADPRFLPEVMAATPGLPVRLAAAHTGEPDEEGALRTPWAGEPPRRPPAPVGPTLRLEAGRWQLRGGRDGLAKCGLDHLRGVEDAPDERAAWGLLALTDIDDVALVAVPDAAAFPRFETRRRPPPDVDCSVIEPGPGAAAGDPSGAGRAGDFTVDPEWGAADRAAAVKPKLEALADRHGLTLEELLAANPTYRGVLADPAGWPGAAAPVLVPEPPDERPPRWTDEDTFQAADAAVRFCQLRRDCVALLDPPPGLRTPRQVEAYRDRFDTSYAGLYWPWLLVERYPRAARRRQRAAGIPEVGRLEAPPSDVRLDPSGLRASGRAPAGDGTIAMPPSGVVAGLTAAADLAVGPHRSPAGQTARAVIAAAVVVDDEAHGALNARGIDVFRERVGRGVVLEGARSLSREQRSGSPWRHLNVRRVLLAVAEAIAEGTQWSVFEPNDRALWTDLRDQIRSFLTSRWRRGWLMGEAPELAFHVRCDESTNPPESLELGRVVALIGLRFPPPIEWIVVRIGRSSAGVEVLDVERAA